MPTWADDIDRRVNFAMAMGIDRAVVKAGDPIVIMVGGSPGIGNTNTVRVAAVPKKMGEHVNVLVPPDHAGNVDMHEMIP
nr:hypothetical protein BaRGS_008898 [Batillaria attramentaria]